MLSFVLKKSYIFYGLAILGILDFPTQKTGIIVGSFQDGDINEILGIMIINVNGSLIGNITDST